MTLVILAVWALAGCGQDATTIELLSLDVDIVNNVISYEMRVDNGSERPVRLAVSRIYVLMGQTNVSVDEHTEQHSEQWLRRLQLSTGQPFNGELVAGEIATIRGRGNVCIHAGGGDSPSSHYGRLFVEIDGSPRSFDGPVESGTFPHWTCYDFEPDACKPSVRDTCSLNCLDQGGYRQDPATGCRACACAWAE